MSKFKKGDCVRVKNGVFDPDYPEIDISGWQGRIEEYEGEGEDGGDLYTISWDSISLRSLDSQIIMDSLEEGIDYTMMALLEEDLEPANARDTEEDVVFAIAELEEAYFWSELGEQGDRIRDLLSQIKSTDVTDVLNHWKKYLESNLSFPLKVIYVGESTDGMSEGAKMTINALDSVEEENGIIALVQFAKGNKMVPLCDFDVEVETEANQALNDYCVWFANF
jgi:hypothetical protein